MPIDTEQLVRDAQEITGAAPPGVMEADAPVLSEAMIASAGEDGIYLVGLIGGKDVGKSAMVNALVGKEITARTSHGPGTEIVVGYCHEKKEPELRELLDREVPGKYRVVTHAIPRLFRQVLLDLPDIDSHFAEHVEITRRMLRHMLFPIWVQSVEKYADVQPQKLLAKVAAGNDPTNFVFCLNKADQLLGGNGDGAEPRSGAGTPPAVAELRDDYAARVAKALALPAAPRVYMISAIHPDRFDLPILGSLLSQQKTEEVVTASKKLAGRQRDKSVLAWLERQDVPGRGERLARLEHEAQELAAQRLGVPLAEGVVPKILDDPAYRAAMSDGVLARRVARWPLLSLVHTLLVPLRFLIRENTSARPALLGAEAMVDAQLRGGGQSVARMVQTTFAQLNQSHPAVAELYRRRPLWEALPSETAEAELRGRLAGTVERQRAVMLQRLAGRTGVISPLVRWALTIGAILWFPFVQPVLLAALSPHSIGRTPRDVALLAVQVLGVSYLLQSVAFLILWFLILWLWVRWNTTRRVAKLLSRWKSGGHKDPELNLTTQALGWVDELLEPIRSARARVDSLVKRMTELRSER